MCRMGKKTMCRMRNGDIMQTECSTDIVQNGFCIMSGLHCKGDIIQKTFCTLTVLHYSTDIVQNVFLHNVTLTLQE